MQRRIDRKGQFGKPRCRNHVGGNPKAGAQLWILAPVTAVGNARLRIWTTKDTRGTAGVHLRCMLDFLSVVARRPSRPTKSRVPDRRPKVLTKRDDLPMIRPPKSGDDRPREQIEEHFAVEKRLAERLLSADRESRKRLYASLYDELFRLVPHHPQLTRKRSPEDQQRVVAAQLAVIERYLRRDATYMEIGVGDCAMAFRVSGAVAKVYGVDVSETITESVSIPDNFELIISDGCNVPVPPNSVDFAYSNQLMEHLHPEDAREQLDNVFRALAPGGRYFCITPHRFAGPHDVSYSFALEARGFHLKEYTVGELDRLFKAAGFRKVRLLVGRGEQLAEWPTWPARACELVLGLLPARWRHALARWAPLRSVFRIYLIGEK